MPPSASLQARTVTPNYGGMHTVIDPAHTPRKTKPTGCHPDKALSAPFIRSAPQGRHADGNGLYLFVQPSGTRGWIQRLVVRGRRRELGLGSVRLVSLAEAREKALANRKLAREGGDPLAEKRRAEGMPSFSEAAMRVQEQKRAGWRSRSHAQSWLSGLQRYAFPRIGKMPVSEVSSADVLEILAPIWHVKPDMPGKLRRHMRAVLEWAAAMELRIDNPCDRVGPVLGPQHKVVQHMRALPHRKVGGHAEPEGWHRARCSGCRGDLPRGRRVTVVPVAIILASRGVAGRQLPSPFWRQTTPMTEGTLTKVALVEQVADVADLTKKRAEVIVETVGTWWC